MLLIVTQIVKQALENESPVSESQDRASHMFERLYPLRYNYKAYNESSPKRIEQQMC
ncbi:MAG: hypothetical protein QXZ44_06310 [Ferroplasma sp.]